MRRTSRSLKGGAQCPKTTGKAPQSTVSKVNKAQKDAVLPSTSAQTNKRASPAPVNAAKKARGSLELSKEEKLLQTANKTTSVA